MNIDLDMMSVFIYVRRVKCVGFILRSILPVPVKVGHGLVVEMVKLIEKPLARFLFDDTTICVIPDVHFRQPLDRT